MPRIQANQINQINETNPSVPTGSDDSTQGFLVGDEWLDSSTNTVYKLLSETSPGNAVWALSVSPTASHPVHLDTVDPTSGADSNAGFSVGDHWVNTVTPSVFQATSVAIGNAVWLNLSASASSVIVEDEGIPVSGAPHSTLNFVGSGIVASDGGGGKVTVTVNTTVAAALVSVRGVSCPELVFSRSGCVLSLRNGC
jgi:hypothetical protein